MAIKILLLLAFDAMLDSRLNAAEKPKDVKKREIKKTAVCCTGDFMKTENKMNPVTANTIHSRVL